MLLRENAAVSKDFTILPEPNLGKTPPLLLVFTSLEYCWLNLLKSTPSFNLTNTSLILFFPIKVVSEIKMCATCLSPFDVLVPLF